MAMEAEFGALRHDAGPPSVKILVVDEEYASAELIAFSLERWGYDAVVVAGAVESLRRIERDPRICSVLIANFEMSRMRGDELARRARETIQGLQVILMSKAADRDAAEAAGRDGFFFLAEPFDLATLLASVAEAVKATNVPPPRPNVPSSPRFPS